MALANDDLERIRQRIEAAYKIEEPSIKLFREFARSIKQEVKPIRHHLANAVSFVSADGGDNRLSFNPALIELVRVVDSRGVECAIDAIASNATVGSLDYRAKDDSPSLVPPLRRLCQDLSVQVSELSYLLGGLGVTGKSTGAMRIYRDIVEWSVLYDLLFKDWGGDTILVREGLLRTKSFKRAIFPEIDKRIRAGCEAHKKKNINVSIVGVAKQSAVLSRLTVALELEGVFHKNYPCYAEVPKDVEENCYNFDRTWLDTLETSEPDEEGKYLYQSFGRLYLVKFGDQPFDPVWPVDIAEWDIHQAGKIIGQLLHDAQPGFPIPDFPMSVQKAHDFAKIGGIEISVLQDILLKGMQSGLTDAEKAGLLRLCYLTENLTNRRYKNA